MRTKLIIGLATTFASALPMVSAQGQEAAGEGSPQAETLTMTCADLTSLDTETAANMVFYIAGYSDGQSTMLAASGPADSEADPIQSGGDQDAAGTGGQSADNLAGEASEAAEEETSAGAAESRTTASAGGLGISVEQVLAACAESPDSPGSEVIKVSRGAAQPDVEPQDEDPAAEGADGQDVGAGNAVVE
jgi:hypothetical protein